MSEAQQYSQEELDEIAEAIWGNGLYRPGIESISTACPRCGADATVRPSPEVGAHNIPVRFRATCSECGARGRGKASEKECRRLTDEEMEEILPLARRGEKPPCPVCQAPLFTKELGVAGRAAGPWVITCHRCGTRGQSD